MNVAIISESPADEAAIKILSECILGCSIDTIPIKRRAHGWAHVVLSLPNFIRQLHFHTAAVGAIIVLDSDSTPAQVAEHELEGRQNPRCRLCQLRETVAATCGQLPPRTIGPPIQFAVGLAVPAMEAWYRCGCDHNVCETAWLNGVKAQRLPYSREELKAAVYGAGASKRQKNWLSTIATAEVTRIVTAGHVNLLEQQFPNGFGHLARQLRTWSH
jgi:hypothetical protein